MYNAITDLMMNEFQHSGRALCVVKLYTTPIGTPVTAHGVCLLLLIQ